MIHGSGSKTQVTFHRSTHSFTFWKVTLTLNLANPRPKVGLGLGLAKLRVRVTFQKVKE